MKKITMLLLCVFSLIGSTSYAQNKGEMFFGGNLGIGVTAIEDGTNFAMNFSPEYGYFVAKNFRVGVNLNYTYNVAHLFTINPSIAYYVKLVDKFYYVPELTVGGGLEAFDDEAFGLFQLGLNLFAVEFRPTQHFAVAVSMLNLSYAQLERVNMFNFNLMGSSSVGLRFYF